MTINFRRILEESIRTTLGRGKSILLLGPRQTGKTTLLSGLDADLSFSLLSPSVRQRYERDPDVFASEINSLRKKKQKPLLVVVDEVQKLPILLDLAQGLIDANTAQFVFTGSSARKLRRGTSVNLLPGRVVSLRLDPLILDEFAPSNVEQAIFFGALPGIARLGDAAAAQETDLRSYVETYLEEEIREEALVRNVGLFSRFLELAATDSGHIVNFSAVAADIGLSHATVRSYYEILEDCLIVERIDPITKSATRKKLTKSCRYLMFDLGVRRLAANEGTRVDPDRKGRLFEQFVGLELLRACRLYSPFTKVKFWRDPDGPEVDWILETHGDNYQPIEVKFSEKPSNADGKHLLTFMDEYANCASGIIICRTPREFTLSNGIRCVPWQQIDSIVAGFVSGR